MENPFARKGIIDTVGGWVKPVRKQSPIKKVSEEPIVEIKWSLSPTANTLSGERDAIWKLTNIHSKPFVVWGASHSGVCDGYSVSVLDTIRVVAPGESIELLTRHRVRTIILECTEYETIDDACAGYEYHQKHPKEYYGETEHSFESGLKPVFPFQYCTLTLDYQAESVLSDCNLSETYRPAEIVIEDIRNWDKLHGRYGRSMFRFQDVEDD